MKKTYIAPEITVTVFSEEVLLDQASSFVDLPDISLANWLDN